MPSAWSRAVWRHGRVTRITTWRRTSGSPGPRAGAALRRPRPGAAGLRRRACDADVRELPPDGCPGVCVHDAPFGYVAASRTYVDAGFLHGATLPDPAGILEGRGRSMRHVKLRPGRMPHASALQALVVAAYRDTGARLEVGRPGSTAGA